MREHFAGYYRPSQQEMEQIWKSALFAFDANVLLNAYRYTPATRDKLLDAIESLADRAWLPHQAGLEFHQNRHDVIAGIRNSYQAVQKELDRHLKALEEVYKRHPYLGSGTLPELVSTFMASAKHELADAEAKHPDMGDASDPVLDRLTKIFSGRVGDEFDTKRTDAIFKEGETRYSKKIPPGWKDESKGDARKFGDLIVWKQLIEKAQVSKVPLIFVTDDRKEDWWWEHKGKTLGPRPELVQEFLRETGQQFYMYDPEQYLRLATKPSTTGDIESAIAEVEDVSKAQRRRKEANALWNVTPSDSLWRRASLRDALVERLAGTTVSFVENTIDPPEVAKLVEGAVRSVLRLCGGSWQIILRDDTDGDRWIVVVNGDKTSEVVAVYGPLEVRLRELIEKVRHIAEGGV